MSDSPTHHYESVPVQGGRVRIRIDDAPGDRVPLILAHGGPGVTDYLSMFFETPVRAAGYRPIGLVQRGCTSSSPSEGPFTVDANADDIDAVREYLRAPQIALLGHSWGGLLATYYAARNPGRVERLILVCPIGLKAGWEEERQETLLSRLSEEERTQLARIDARVNDEALRMTEADFQQAMAQRYTLLNAGYYAPKHRTGKPALSNFRWNVHRDTMESVRNLSKDGKWLWGLRSLQCPVTIFRGTEDAVPAACADQYVEALPHARIVDIEGSGHFPWMEEGERFGQALEEALGLATGRRR